MNKKTTGFSGRCKYRENLIFEKQNADSYKYSIEEAGGKDDGYREALEEIEEDIKSLRQDVCSHCGCNSDSCTPTGNVCGELMRLLDSINKAKGEGDE